MTNKPRCWWKAWDIFAKTRAFKAKRELQKINSICQVMHCGKKMLASKYDANQVQFWKQNGGAGAKSKPPENIEYFFKENSV